MGNRKNYSAEFKLKVVMENFQRDTTIEEVRKRYGVCNSAIHKWRDEFKKGKRSIFR